jgi:steroid 5-alpha reductase family enzyme
MAAIDLTDMFYALLLAIVLVFGARYVAAIFQAWAQKSQDRQYRALAERVIAVQAQNQATLTALQSDLAKVAASVAAVEQVLKQVE